MNEKENKLNTNLEQELGKRWSADRLSETEKGQIRSGAILRGLELANQEKSRAIHSPSFFSLSHHLKAFSFGILGVIFIGGGISYAAEHTTPGEIMYPIKTTFNEQIIELVAISDESSARAKVSIIERRKKEIEKMVKEDSLTDEAVEIISKNIEHHVKEALTSKKSKASAKILKDELSDLLEDSADQLEDAEVAIKNKKKLKIVHTSTASGTLITASSSVSTSTSTVATSTKIEIDKNMSDEDLEDNEIYEDLDEKDSETIKAIDSAREVIEDLNKSVESLED